MSIITNPAMWASLGALLGAIGLEMVPAIQLGDHVIAAVAAISGLIGIVQSLRTHYVVSVTPKEEKK